MRAACMITPAYTLSLGQGLTWQIIATEEISSWMRQFAAITQLKSFSGGNFPKLIFTALPLYAKLPSSISSILYGVSDNISFDDAWHPEDLGLITLWRNQHSKHIICQLSNQSTYETDINKMSLSLHPIYQKAIEGQGLPLHAALIEKAGMGVVLAAPGSTGKSTCCRRIHYPWQVLCDDETLLTYDAKSGFCAHPFPTWSEYLYKRSQRTWNIEKEISLSAIFFLAQGKSDELVSIAQAESAAFLYQLSLQIYGRGLRKLQACEGKRQSRCLFDNACRLAKAVPAHILRVSREGNFWEKMEEAFEKV